MFKKLFYCWLIISVIITVVMSLDIVKLKDYCFGNFRKEFMKIDTVISSFDSDSKLLIVEGKINSKKVQFSEQKKNHKYIFQYLNNGNNIQIPVIKFKNSNGVILIRQNENTKKTIERWLTGKIIVYALAYLPLIIFLILSKLTKL